ncbi:MAG: RNA polymerase sigma factor [Betaproteobacteria bacterium]
MTLHANRTIEGDDDDPAWARFAAAGDAAAFERIMRRHNRMLFRTARSILRNDADAEDCLQAAYLLAWRSIGTFAGEAKLSTWLARIVINEALGRIRRASRRAVVIPIDGAAEIDALPADYDAAPSTRREPEREAMRQELKALIERRIDALPEGFRSVFVLRALEELTVEETGAMLGIPDATVRSRYFRARALLRESLARDVDAATDGAFAFDGERCDRIVAAVIAAIAATAR